MCLEVAIGLETAKFFEVAENAGALTKPVATGKVAGRAASPLIKAGDHRISAATKRYRLASLLPRADS
jgi:hypothetical protein